MNFETYLKARLSTNDIEEKEAITKAYKSECIAVKEAIADFIYSKVKDTEEFQMFASWNKNGLGSCRNNVEAMQVYLSHIYRNLRIRGRSKAKVESMFKEFQNQIGLTEFLHSDAIGDKKAFISGEFGQIVVG